jgi:hypothetical protein
VGKFFKNSTCIYLDQYAVSNILSESDDTWKEIKCLITQGTESEKIIVPYSFEHLLETSNRPYEVANTHDQFLFKLSGRLKIRSEQAINTKVIINRIRKRSDDISTFTEEIEDGQLNSFAEHAFYSKLHAQYKSMTGESTQLLNIIRGASSQKPKLDKDLQKIMVQLMINRYQSQLTTRFHSYSKTGKFIRQPVELSNITIPFWADVLVDSLVDTHKLTKKEAKRGKELINNNGLKIIPAIYIRSAIEGFMGAKQQKEDINDHIDITRLCVSVPFADIVLTDKARHFDLTTLQLDTMFNTEIYSGTSSELAKFTSRLKELIN